MRDAAGQPQYTIGMVEDLTEQAEARRQHAAAARQIARATAEIAARERELRGLRSGLTAREWQILELVVRGETTARIAAALNVQPETVKTHLRNLGHKFGLAGGGRAALIAAVRQRGLFPPAEALDQPAPMSG